jgi:type II secretory pathway predicted ATPase ExeA/cell division septation protein DedD
MSSSVFPGLREAPFNVTPDQRFLYLNDCYRDALAALTDGIETRQGILALIGEAGTGKTMLLRRLLDTLQPSVNAVLLLYPTVGFEEILEHVLLVLGIPAEGTQLDRLRRLNEFLVQHTTAGGNVAVVIDEAQDIDAGVLAKLPLLSNPDTAGKSRLQILFVGQPELNVNLADLEALEKRVVRRVSLGPLAATEVGRYVRSRLERAGAVDSSLFTDDALDWIASLSGGIPGLVNAICDAAMRRALAAGATEVTAEIVVRAWSYSAASDLPWRAESAAELAAAAMVPAPESVAAVVSEPTTETPPELETASVIENEAAMETAPVVETAPPVETPRAPETAPANDPAPVTIAPAKPSVSPRVWSIGVAGALAIIFAAGLYGLSLRSGREHTLQAVSRIATRPAPLAPSVADHRATAEIAGPEEPVPAGLAPSPDAPAMASANGEPPEPDTGHNDDTTSDSVKVQNASVPQQEAVEADQNIVAAPPVPATVRAAPPRHATTRPFVRSLDGSRWTVQVGSTTDAVAAARERDRLTDRGFDAFLQPAIIGERSWQRVMVGHYPTFAEAERTIAQLTTGAVTASDP